MKMKLSRLFVVVLLVCGSASSLAQQKADLKWGYIASVAFYWDVFSAIDQGFMAKENLNIEPVRVDSASQSIQLLITGAVDILSSNPELALNAIDKGAQLSIIGAEVVKAPWALMVRPGVKDYGDLKGKLIGVTQINDASTRMTELLLEKHGLKKGDYEEIPLGGTPNRYAALSKGAVEATVLAQPADFKAEAAGMRRLGSVSESFDGPAIVFLARKDWLKTHGDMAVRFLRGTGKGSTWLYDAKNEQAALKVLAKHINAKEGEARQTYDMYIRREGIISRDGKLPIQHVQNYLDIRSGKTGAKADSYVDFSFVEKATAK
ncbi:MAG: ABC transporter substrate-binding protein [Paralcaligenes sp.]